MSLVINLTEWALIYVTLKMPNVSNESLDIEITGKREKSIPWKKSEEIIRKSRSDRHTTYEKYSRSFNEAFLIKLKNSTFGCYIDVFNPQQDQNTNENKLEITQWELKTSVRFGKNNGFIDNGFDYLKRIIAEEKPVKMENLVEMIKFLRLDTIYVSYRFVCFMSR